MIYLNKSYFFGCFYTHFFLPSHFFLPWLLHTTPGAPRALLACWWMCFPAQQVGCDHQEPGAAAAWNLPPSAASHAAWLRRAPAPASPLSPSRPDMVPALQPPASCVEHAPSVRDHKHTHTHSQDAAWWSRPIRTGTTIHCPQNSSHKQTPKPFKVRIKARSDLSEICS